MEQSQVILNFILFTLATLVAGLLVGGGLGILFAWLCRLLFRKVPGLRPPLLLLPWRTFLFGAVLFFFSRFPFYAFSRTIRQPQMIEAFPAGVFLLLVFFFAFERLLAHWLPSGVGFVLAGLVRTLAVACGVILALGAQFGTTTILAYTSRQVAATFRFEGIWVALGVILGLALFFDLLLGVVQMLFASRDQRKVEKGITTLPVG